MAEVLKTTADLMSEAAARLGTWRFLGFCAVTAIAGAAPQKMSVLGMLRIIGSPPRTRCGLALSTAATAATWRTRMNVPLASG